MDVDEEESEDEEVDMTEAEMQTLNLTPQQPAASSQVTEDDIFKVTVGPQTTEEDSIFKVTIGPQGGACAAVGDEGGAVCGVDVFMPCPRMNALLAVKGNTLFLYGGLFEVGDRQVTLCDMYSLDLQKLDEWKVIIENNADMQVNICPFTL